MSPTEPGWEALHRTGSLAYNNVHRRAIDASHSLGLGRFAGNRSRIPSGTLLG